MGKKIESDLFPLKLKPLQVQLDNTTKNRLKDYKYLFGHTV